MSFIRFSPTGSSSSSSPFAEQSTQPTLTFSTEGPSSAVEMPARLPSESMAGRVVSSRAAENRPLDTGLQQPVSTHVMLSGKFATAATRLLLAQHRAARDSIHEFFGLSRCSSEKMHVINLAAPSEGRFLARYLGIPEEHVLTAKSGSSIRKLKHVTTGDESGGRVRSYLGGKTKERVEKAIASYIVRHGDNFRRGTIILLGHRDFDHVANEALCGHIQAIELRQLLGGDQFAPEALSLFFCNSYQYNLAPATRLTWVKASANFSIFPAGTNNLEQHAAVAFYHSGDLAQKADHLVNRTSIMSLLEGRLNGEPISPG